jgi:CBS domain containing-hemolysin-like protein
MGSRRYDPTAVLSAGPSPIPEPLLAAAVAALTAGLFACADTALTSVSTARLGALAQEAPPKYQKHLERVVAHRTTLQARYLAGRTVSLLVAAAGATLWVSQHYATAATRAAFAACILLTLAIVMEVAAGIGRLGADWVIPVAARALRPLELLMAPIAFLTSSFTRLFKWRKEGDRRVIETEVELIVAQSERSGVLEQEPAEMIRNVLEFNELSARDAMVPRTKVQAIQADTPLDKVLELVVEAGHSRYPVYRRDMDDIFGLIYAKDLYQVMQDARAQDQSGEHTPDGQGGIAQKRLNELVREPVKFVSESQPLSSVLREMKNERQHLAVVVDEFGGTSGIVTLEDVLEEIVGDIRDEHDTDEAPIVEVAPGRLVVDADVVLSDLSAYLGYDLDPEGQYDSLAGMLTDRIGSVPAVGTSIRTSGMRFIIRDADEKRVAKVEIVRGPQLADTSGAHPAADASGSHRTVS